MSLLVLFNSPPIPGFDVARTRVNEYPPMRQYLLATTPGGRTYRWGEDGTEVDQVLDDLSDSDSVPGGYKEATGRLARKPGIDYRDMQRGTRLEIFGAGQLKVWEGRLERAPRSSGDILAMEPAAVGYETHLTDDNSVQEIFIDGDLTAWGEPSTRYRASNPAVQANTHSEVQLLPAGDPAAGGVAAISHSWTSMDNRGGAEPDYAGNWYDGGGVPLGRVLLDWVNIRGIGVGDTNWLNIIGAGASDNGTTALFDFNGTTTTGKDIAVPEDRYFLEIYDHYGPAFFGNGNWQAQWRNVKVLGRHGLTLQGTWPNVGLLASDVIAYALGRWAPFVKFSTGTTGTIRPTAFAIPQLTFKEPTTVAEVLAQATRFELSEWGVWNDQTFYLNPRGEREGRKRWRARVRPAQLEETGQQMDRVWNGVIVQGQDVDGTAVTVGPPGSGYRLTDARLLDSDPLNPANQVAGLRRWVKIQLNGIATVAGMVEAGSAFLEQTKLLDGSGRATLTGYVEDDSGKLWPYYCVHAGDLIEFVDSSIPGYRYIVSAQRSRASKSVSIDLDAPPDSYEALMERLNAEILSRGL